MDLFAVAGVGDPMLGILPAEWTRLGAVVDGPFVGGRSLLERWRTEDRARSRARLDHVWALVEAGVLEAGDYHCMHNESGVVREAIVPHGAPWPAFVRRLGMTRYSHGSHCVVRVRRDPSSAERAA